jgi:hypothetical protein
MAKPALPLDTPAKWCSTAVTAVTNTGVTVNLADLGNGFWSATNPAPPVNAPTPPKPVTVQITASGCCPTSVSTNLVFK